MNKWTWLLVGILLIWALLSINWYVCEIKGFCDASFQTNSEERESISIAENADEVADRPDENLQGGEVRVGGTEVIRTTETTETIVTISCPTHINSSIRLGGSNISSDVERLEQFLNTYEGESLDVDGVYTASDDAAVRRFQEEYAEAILEPLGLSSATGNVLTSTRNHINRLYCANTVEIDV